MPLLAGIVDRYRLVGLAVLLSAAVHAAVFVGMPARIEAIDEKAAAIYSATLDTIDLAAPTAKLAPAAAPRRAAPKSRSRIAPRPLPPPVQVASAIPVASDAPALSDAAPAGQSAPPSSAEAGPVAPPPELLAMAPAIAPAPPPEPEPFPVEALPASLSISYHLTSAFAEGRAAYSWERDGDNYRITGEAEAEGFFALFLEGRITQESRGTVTSEGLRPERFRENKPNSPPEGLDFDWPSRRITFERKGERSTAALTDNTVDWLSMIFQLAHAPPRGETTELQVFTQRRMYTFKLQVLGFEEIEIPFGRVQTLHLRHVDPKDATEVVDVWLGVGQHYLPVKLRFPVARNRLMVEQVATRVSAK